MLEGKRCSSGGGGGSWGGPGLVLLICDAGHGIAGGSGPLQDQWVCAERGGGRRQEREEVPAGAEYRGVGNDGGVLIFVASVYQ